MEFALPRLAASPQKARADQASAKIETAQEQMLAQLNDAESAPQDRYGFNSYFQKVSFKSANSQDENTDEEMKDVTTRQKIELQPRETREIEIPRLRL